MMEKVLDYGLKESYNFKEIHVPTTQILYIHQLIE